MSLLLSIGGLQANIRNHFLFEIVSSKEIVSEILVSKSFILLTQGRRKFSDIGKSTRKKGTYEVGTYLRFSYERLWQGWLFQVLKMSKKFFKNIKV